RQFDEEDGAEPEDQGGDQGGPASECCATASAGETAACEVKKGGGNELEQVVGDLTDEPERNPDEEQGDREDLPVLLEEGENFEELGLEGVEREHTRAPLGHSRAPLREN